MEGPLSPKKLKVIDVRAEKVSEKSENIDEQKVETSSSKGVEVKISPSFEFDQKDPKSLPNDFRRTKQLFSLITF